MTATRANTGELRRYRVVIEIRRKSGVRDPEGATIEKLLPNIRGLDIKPGEITDVRKGTELTVTMHASNRDELREAVKRMMALPLQIINPSMDEYEILRIKTLKRKNPS
jgi:phosphoribosylformylglycinamidine (FGAM) synthase PurS component